MEEKTRTIEQLIQEYKENPSLSILHKINSYYLNRMVLIKSKVGIN